MTGHINESAEEAASLDRIEEALNLYEAEGEDALERIQEMLSEDEFDAFMDEIEDEEDEEFELSDGELLNEMAVHDCSSRVVVAEEDRKNELCAVFPAYAVSEIAKNALNVVLSLDTFLKTEHTGQGHFVLYKNSNKVFDSASIPLSYHPKNIYEHREEFHLFLREVISYLKKEIPPRQPKKYPDAYEYKVVFAFDEGEEEVSIILVVNDAASKELDATCMFGTKKYTISENGLKHYADAVFHAKR